MFYKTSQEHEELRASIREWAEKEIKRKRKTAREPILLDQLPCCIFIILQILRTVYP